VKAFCALYQVSPAKKAARVELMLADQELFHIRNLAEQVRATCILWPAPAQILRPYCSLYMRATAWRNQEREDCKAAEKERKLPETAHELVTDIEALPHRPSAR
jgi:hypothetical protein